MINAFPISDSGDFHVMLSEKTNMTIRTNYADKDKPITYIGDVERGLDLTADEWLIVADNKFLIMDKDVVRQAVIEYYEKYVASGKNVCEELLTIE